MIKFSHQLKYERELRGWSQAKVAEEIGTGNINVSRWERGTTFPSPYFREKLCELFEKSPAELGLVERPADVAEMSPASASPVSPASLPLEQLMPAPSYVLDPLIPLYPTYSLPLIGRDGLIEGLVEHFCRRDQIVLGALHGLPGVGKTALAVALSRNERVREHFSDGVLWAGLGPTPQLVEHLKHWGILLGLSSSQLEEPQNMQEWATYLRTLIGQRRMLVILDDIWQLEDALSLQVGGIRCSYLFTTRFPALALSLAGNAVTEVAELDEQDGLGLLARFIPLLIDTYEQPLRAIVREVGGLPLALTLIGKYLQMAAYNKQPRRIQEALKRMQNVEQQLRLSLPQGSANVHPSLTSEMEMSLQTIIAISDQRLSAEAQSGLRALARLPAKPNSFSEATALTIMGSTVEVLDQLFDAGLIESTGEGRYSMHPLIANYALQNNGQQVSTQPQETQTHRRGAFQEFLYTTFTGK